MRKLHRTIFAELRALRQTVERLEQRINAMDVSVSLVDDDMQMLNNWLHNYVAEFEPRLLGIQSAFGERVDDLDDYIRRARVRPE